MRRLRARLSIRAVLDNCRGRYGLDPGWREGPIGGEAGRRSGRANEKGRTSKTMKAKTALPATPRPLLRSVVVLALLLAGVTRPIPADAAAPPKIPEAAKQFLELARANFAAWDFLHKGTLTRPKSRATRRSPSSRAMQPRRWRG